MQQGEVGMEASLEPTDFEFELGLGLGLDSGFLLWDLA